MNTFRKVFALSKSDRLTENLKNYLRVVFIWCPIVTVMFIFGFGGFDNLALRFAISMIIAATVSTFCFFGSWVVRRIYNFYGQKRGLEIKKESMFWGLLTSLPFLLPGLYFGFLFSGKFTTAIGHAWTPPSFSDYSSGIIFGIMVSGLFTLFEVIRESKQAKQTAELRYRSLENEKLKAQISALTAQMNPHLLFNALNTIASTITTDPKSAEDMVVQLSELYRGILRSAKGDMHTLENELLLCRSYLEIEKKRFGPRINYQINIQNDIDPQKIKIPVLLLQPLVENAVKHGLTPKRDGGSVSIEIQKDDSNFFIRVVDDGVGLGFKNASVGTGTGLSNCRSRMKLKYGEASSFSFTRNNQNQTAASISIPLSEALCD